jgi:hypothetical protein
MLDKFDEIVSSNEFDDFMLEFTRGFLKEFYGTVDFFCVAAISKDSTFEVIERAKLFFHIVENEPRFVSSILRHGIDKFEDLSSDYSDEDDWFDLINGYLKLFVVDLFQVTKVPIKYACKLNKGAYPNGDLISNKIIKFNIKHNLKILKYLYDHKNASSS